jgi:hypothetical protein
MLIVSRFARLSSSKNKLRTLKALTRMNQLPMETDQDGPQEDNSLQDESTISHEIRAGANTEFLKGVLGAFAKASTPILLLDKDHNVAAYNNRGKYLVQKRGRLLGRRIDTINPAIKIQDDAEVSSDGFRMVARNPGDTRSGYYRYFALPFILGEEKWTILSIEPATPPDNSPAVPAANIQKMKQSLTVILGHLEMMQEEQDGSKLDPSLVLQLQKVQQHGLMMLQLIGKHL